LGFDGAAFTKDDASGNLDHSSSLTLLMNLGIPEIKRGNTVRLGKAALLTVLSSFPERGVAKVEIIINIL